MALESQKINSAGLFIPNGLLWPGVHSGAKINIWAQNPDPKMLTPRNCLGTSYVARASDVTRTDGPISLIEEKVHGIIDEHMKKVLNVDMNDHYVLSTAGKVVLAECLDALSDIFYRATDMVVDVRSFSDSSSDKIAAVYKARVELHLAGTAYNRKL